LYGEGTISTQEAEIEQRFIFDKDFGDFLAALNITSEFGWDFSTPSTDRTYELEIDAGISYLASDRFSFGLELKNHNEFPNSSTWAHSALFLGPVVSYSQNRWWTSLTVLPQIVGLKGATQDHLVLDNLERIEVRLLFGIHL
jgi:hypothetical protein